MRNAVDESRRHGHDHVGTEHLLVSLVSSRDSTGELLRSSGLSESALRRSIETLVAKPQRGSKGQADFSARTYRVLAFARNEAEAHGEKIAPRHLLIGILREGEGVAAMLLESAGIDLADLALRLDRRT